MTLHDRVARTVSQVFDDRFASVADVVDAVAAAVINDLELTEEVSVRVGQLSGCTMSPSDLQPHHTVIARRYLTAWESV